MADDSKGHIPVFPEATILEISVEYHVIQTGSRCKSGDARDKLT